MAKIDICELAVKEYSTEDVIEAVTSLMRMGRTFMNKAFAEQNLGYAGQAFGLYSQAETLLDNLDKKLNGKKTPTVVN